MSLPQIDVAYAAGLFDELYRQTEDVPGVTRAAYGEGEQIGHAILRREGAAIGLCERVDAAGNLYLTYPGKDPSRPAWLIGSHLDFVPHGGNFDGAAGVLAGLAAIRTLKAHNIELARSVVLMVIRAEESCWFPVSYLGSRAALGLLPPDCLSVRRADSGRTLREHLDELGFDPDRLARNEAGLRPDDIAAFIELHIEQGPVLESRGATVGLVTAIAGSFRYRTARCIGEWGHSGAVPRAHRHDAVFALAELISALDDLWQTTLESGRQATITVGEIGTDPAVHGFSKIPGEVWFCLDVRSGSAEVLDHLHTELLRLAGEIEARRGVRFALGERTGSRPTALDAGLRRRIAEEAEASGIAFLEMASGAGHDTAAFALAGVPSALIFVRNQNGSHNPDEAMRIADFAVAADLLARFLARHASAAPGNAA